MNEENDEIVKKYAKEKKNKANVLHLFWQSYYESRIFLVSILELGVCVRDGFQLQLHIHKTFNRQKYYRRIRILLRLNVMI